MKAVISAIENEPAKDGLELSIEVTDEHVLFKIDHSTDKTRWEEIKISHFDAYELMEYLTVKVTPFQTLKSAPKLFLDKGTLVNEGDLFKY